jgi:hypothetical protein
MTDTCKFYLTDAEPSLIAFDAGTRESRDDATHLVTTYGVPVIVRDYDEPHNYILGFKSDGALRWADLATDDLREAATKARNDYLGGARPATDHRVFAQDTVNPPAPYDPEKETHAEWANRVPHVCSCGEEHLSLYPED